jgi:hypothetical protein
MVSNPSAGDSNIYALLQSSSGSSAIAVLDPSSGMSHDPSFQTLPSTPQVCTWLRPNCDCVLHIVPSEAVDVSCK